MLGRLIAHSLWKQRRRTVLVLLSVTTAAALISAFLNIAFQITEGMAKELRSFGANILLVPKAEPLEIEIGGLRYVTPEESAYLEEADLRNIKTIFWRHNIEAFTPFLSGVVNIKGEQALLVGTWFEKEITIPEGSQVMTLPGGIQKAVDSSKQVFRTGLRELANWWDVEGSWIGEEEKGVLVGSALARRLDIKLNETIRVAHEGKTLSLPVRGIVRTGGSEEEQIFVELKSAQELFGLPGKVEKVQVSALVTPDNALAVRAQRIGADVLPPEEYETWYCTPYLSSIIYQLVKAIPYATGKAIRRVSEAEGSFLGKMRLTFVLIIAIAFLVASLGIMATMGTAVLERRNEIGLMKALGADGNQIALQFFLEAGIIGLVGGCLGYLGGLVLAEFLAAQTFSLASFDLSISLQSVILAVTLVLAVCVVLAGAFFPVKQAMRQETIRVLRGN